ncbi:MAG: hypothetical protein Q4G45_03175 [Actinomycetia bacterium]|nr:hypothetical protein [Actinomycetes bacterium]
MSLTIAHFGQTIENEPATVPVRSLSLRFAVMTALTALADPTHQSRHWGVDVPGDDDYDSLAEHVSCLYDDCAILPRPASAVGLALRHSEVAPIALLGRRLGDLLLDLGDADDLAYLADARWPGVVEAAAAALDAMES